MKNILKHLIFAFCATLVFVSCNREVTIEQELGNQQYFFKTFLSPSVGLGALTEQLPNGDMLVVSSEGTTTREFNSVSIRKTDPFGNLIWTKSIPTMTDFFAQGILMSNGDLLLINRWTSSEILRINPEGVVVFHKKFNTSFMENFIIAPPVELANGDILISFTNGLGSGQASLNYLATLDSDGNQLKLNKFEDSYFGGKVLTFNVVDYQDDYYTIAGTMFEYPWTGWGNPLKPFCSRVRQGFTAIKTIRNSGNGETAFMRHAFATDGNGAVVVNSPQNALLNSSPSPNRSFEVVQYDKTMNEVWSKDIKWDVLTLEPYSVTTNQNNEIIISGSCSKSGSTGLLPFVVTLDKDGNVLFEKIFQFSRSAELFDAKHLENGDYLLTGMSYGFGQQLDNINSIIVKTNDKGEME